MENKVKRERASNFSTSEVNTLIDVVSTFKHIIENKKTDAVTNAEKEAAWNKICISFNAVSGTINRSAKTLKLKYEGLKKMTKKKVSDNRQEMYKTGGGQPNQIPYTGAEEKVLAICSNMKGMGERKDSDNIITEPPKVEEDITILEFEDIPICLTNPAVSLDSGSAMQLDEEDNNAVVLKNPSEALGCEVTQENEVNDMVPEIKDSWRTWNPRALKAKISPALSNKGITKATVTTKMDELTSARLELTKLQQELTKKELEIKVREHEERLAHMIKEHELRVLTLINDEKRKQAEHVIKINK